MSIQTASGSTAFKTPQLSEKSAGNSTHKKSVDNKRAMQTHILNVEDESAIRDMVRFALERHGHHFHAAATVAEARQLMAGQKMDLAIIDLSLIHI